MVELVYVKSYTRQLGDMICTGEMGCCCCDQLPDSFITGMCPQPHEREKIKL